MKSFEGRFLDIDLIKAIAVFNVILGHVIEGILQEGVVTGSNLILFEKAYHFIYSFHMPLFFCVSGYLMKSPKYSSPFEMKLIKKDIVSLYFPYLIFSYAFFAVKMVMTRLSPGMLADMDFVPKDAFTLFIKPISVFWFLMALLVIRMISRLLHVSFEKEYMPLCISVLLFAFGYCVSVTNYFALNRVFQFLICYEFGYIYRKYGKMEHKVYYACAAGAVATYTLIVSKQPDLYIPKICMGISLFILLHIILGAFNGSKNTILEKISFMGKNSIVFYLVHPFLTGPVRTVLCSAISQPICLMFTELAILVTAPLIVIIIYSKIHYLSWLRYLFYPNQWNLIR